MLSIMSVQSAMDRKIDRSCSGRCMLGPLSSNACRGQVVIPVRLLMRQHGDPTFATILARLRCQRCKGTPAPVYLCAGGREYNGGASPDWAIELVPKRR